MKVNGSLLDFKKLKLGHQEAQFGNEISNLATMNQASVMTPSNLHAGLLEIVLRDYLNAAIYTANVSC